MTGSSTTRRTLGVIGQVALGAALLTAGTGHLTKQREEFQNQVPAWFPADPDVVVVASGVAELALGAALVATWKQPFRALVGVTAAAFFVAVFPGNIAQLTGHRDAFGLDTDTKRAVRLVFQPVLVAWALGSTEAVRTLRDRRARAS
jgi:uncharacterized membrane protein